MNKTILIVDDVPDNLRVLKGVLSKGGYQVRAATSGNKALVLALVEPKPALILLDVMMPGMNGYEVCQRLKTDPTTANIPIIFITAMGDIEDETRAFEHGAVDYIIKPISPPTVLARVKTHLSLVRAESLDALARSAIRMLGEAGHYNDTDTGQHIWRMAAYSRALAEVSGWNEEIAECLELASPMHDTGKIAIPDAILKAPRKLELEEWTVMQSHCQIGYDILSMSDNFVFKLAAEIALNHHEKWNGSGYPQGLAGKNIPESSRIVAIADVFDALTMKRSYKEAWSLEEAFDEIQNSAGSHFEPRLVEHFLNIKEKIEEIKAEWDKLE